MSDYSNMKEDILEDVKDELDTAIIMVTSDSDVSKKNSKFPKELINEPVMLKDVIDYFDYDFDGGYGGQECHDFYIWTKSEVLFIWEYDGSTHISSVPRNPPSFSPSDTHNKDLEVSASPTPKESQKAIPSLNPDIKLSGDI